jgi:hydroxymethylglutaryl-CoA reductase
MKTRGPSIPEVEKNPYKGKIEFWSRNVAFERGQLLAQGGILQGDLFLAGQNEKNETNRNHNRIQHGDRLLSSTQRINCLKARQVLATHNAY